MKTNVMYFTRSGKTKHAAKKLSQVLDAEMYELKDNKNWKGIFGYLKGGFYASSDKPVEISFNNEVMNCEQLVIMSPLWAGGPSPAVRTFIRNHPHNNITLVLTNDGSSVEKAFDRTKELLPSIKNYYGITKKLNNENQVIDQIKNDLK